MQLSTTRMTQDFHVLDLWYRWRRGLHRPVHPACIFTVTCCRKPLVFPSLLMIYRVWVPLTVDHVWSKLLEMIVRLGKPSKWTPTFMAPPFCAMQTGLAHSTSCTTLPPFRILILCDWSYWIQQGSWHLPNLHLHIKMAQLNATVMVRGWWRGIVCTIDH